MRISVYYDTFRDEIVTKETVSTVFSFNSFLYNGTIIWYNYKERLPERYEFIGYL